MGGADKGQGAGRRQVEPSVLPSASRRAENGPRRGTPGSTPLYLVAAVNPTMTPAST
ncbi:hypothetical protein [Candidatus Amarolinea aalborgensis]|uniref:hypothetical protein n=1 Tax=Candidatus Amarolinea aalborgensis TaxID=2249329 RepID=UPI003BF9A893